jgi:hypothetical protein
MNKDKLLKNIYEVIEQRISKELTKKLDEFLDANDSGTTYSCGVEDGMILLSKKIRNIFINHNYNAEAPDERDILLQRIKAVVMEAHENRNPAAREQCADVILKLFLASSYQPQERKND